MQDRSKQPSTVFLDDLWRKVIRLMFSFMCAKCRREGHDCHHVVARADKRHRWHPLNGVLLCATCHAWAHAHPRKFKTWLKRNLPEVYKNSRTKGFEGKDNAYIKHQLNAMRAMLAKVLKSGGNTELALLPTITLIILVVVGLLFVIASPSP